MIKELKYCPTCKENKSLDLFYKNKNKDCYNWQCKSCSKIASQQYYEKNKENIKIKSSEYYFNNRDEGLKQRKEWYDLHKLEVSEKGKEYRQTETWKINHKRDEIKRRDNGKDSEWRKNKYENDINYKIALLLRTRINQVINNNSKSAHTLELLGCSLEQLKSHLESKFQPGMSWENQGKKGWHIDHYIPCFYFDLSNPEQQKICFHYLNLQPLWGKENQSKSNKVPANVLELIEEIKSHLNIAA